MLLDTDFELMSDPKHVRRLKDHFVNELWLKFESLSHARAKVVWLMEKHLILLILQLF
jgi:hypothetical protein